MSHQELQLAFTPERWERVEREWDRFWQGEQRRPMLLMQTLDPGLAPVPGWHRYFPQYDEAMPLEQLVAHESRELSRRRWHGDAFPSRMLDFGPGSLAAYLGSKLVPRPDTVWFGHLEGGMDGLAFRLDPSARWFRRVHAVLEALAAAWGREVQLIPSDMGEGLDILAALRGAQDLAEDLINEPDQVEAWARAMTEVWCANYDAEAAKIKAACRGTASWVPMFSKRTTYMLQCDFSYMISPAMFERFVLPDLDACCRHLTDPFYHLDGPGELPHLDLLLSLPRLKGIQWVPGAGQPDASEWLPVLARIRRAGKMCQVYTHPEGARRIVRELGGAGFVFAISVKDATEALAMENEFAG